MANPFDEFDDVNSSKTIYGNVKTNATVNPFDAYDRYAIDVNALPPNPVEGMTSTQKGLAGVGKGITDYVYGAGNLIRDSLQFISPEDKTGLNLTGGGKILADSLNLPTRQDIEEKRQSDAPLKATTEGGIGEFIGKSSIAAPLSMIPFANTALGSTLAGATIGAVEPLGTNESRAGNVAGGAVGGFVGNKLGRLINDGITSKVAKNAKMQSQNQLQDKTLVEANALGFKVPQSQLTNYNQSFTRNKLEMMSGKAATKQAFSQHNQQVANSVARKTLGLPDDAPLSPDLLKQLRDKDYAVYKEIADLPVDNANYGSLNQPKPKQILSALKDARDNAKAAWKEYSRNQTQSSLKDAKKWTEEATKQEDMLEKYATNKGFPELVDRFREARKNLAINHTLDDAMDGGTGNIDMRYFAKRFDNGDPLTGDLYTLGKFANTFKGVVQPPNQAAGAGISALEPMVQGAGVATSIGTGNPAGLLASGVPLLRAPARGALLADFMNKAPVYNSGALRATNKVSPLLPYLGTVGGGLLGSTN